MAEGSFSKPEAGNALIRVANLSVHFQGRAILEDINFSVEPCSLLGIVGPSGSGKTTLLRCLNRLAEEDRGFAVSGKVCLSGSNVYTEMQKYTLRQQVGIVFQRPAIFPTSILKNVLFGAWHLGLIKRHGSEALAERYLREAFLWDEVKDRLHESALGLSVGQQQRLAIARTLAVSPKVILFDEPTSALDIQATNRIEQLLTELKKTRTLVLVTHSLDQAQRLSEQMIFLGKGTHGARLAFDGSPEEFFASEVKESFALGLGH